MSESDLGRGEFLEWLKESIKSAYPGAKISDDESSFSISSKKSQYGDLGSSIAFRISGIMHAAPKEVAEKLAENAHRGRFISKLIPVNGYINALLDRKEYCAAVITRVVEEKEGYGSFRPERREKVIVEFPSVNPNKPWHIGHLRNALLGDSISRLHEFCGYSVEREDYIEELGLQMAVILWGLKHESKETGKKYDQFLGELYVRFNKEMEEKKAQGEVNALLKEMETTGSKEWETARELAERCVRAQYETAFAYGVYHDVLIWESDVLRARLLEKALAMLEEKGVTEKPEDGEFRDCIIIRPRRDGSGPVKVLIRSNGAPTYVAKDIAFHMWKLGIIKSEFLYKEFVEQPNSKYAYTTAELGKPMDFAGADSAINVIGSAQKYPQEILKNAIAEIGGASFSDKIRHLAYGEIELAEGSLSGRTGGWIGADRNYTADDLLGEMRKKATETIKDLDESAGSAEKEKIAGKVALSAIKFEFLKVDPEKKVIFDWLRALNFDSNSGPYCMYTYARASRILERAGSLHLEIKKEIFEKLELEEEFDIIKLIGHAGDTVKHAQREMRPNVIADYALDLSIAFSRFYEKANVLNSGELMLPRILIVIAFRQTLYNMLWLLGIEAIGRM